MPRQHKYVSIPNAMAAAEVNMTATKYSLVIIGDLKSVSSNIVPKAKNKK